MNDVNVFDYKGNPVRTIEKSGELWWVLKDVCGALAIVDHISVSKRLDEDEKGVGQIHPLSGKGGAQEMLLINEPGLYNVILRSDKPEAKEFKRWVTHEVLPSIRKTGAYSVQKPEPVKRPILPDGITFGSAVGFMRLTRRAMLDMGCTPTDVGMMIKETCEAINFPVPTALTKQLPGQMDLFQRAGLEAVQ